MAHDTLFEIGWKPFFQQQLDHLDGVSDCIVARVAAHYGNQIGCFTATQELSIPIQLTNTVGPVAVGDWLILEPDDHRPRHLLERQSLLTRKAAGEEVREQPMVANVDTIFVACSCNEDFSLSRIERYLALILQAGIVPVVVLTKADLTEESNNLRHQVERLHAGLLVETMDARNAEQVAVLHDWCGPGKSVAILGSSGVGKSTLANALGVGDLLRTAAIRESDGKGRHTTTARSLHRLPMGGVFIDTPGMRELQLTACEDGVADLFDDVVSLAQRCRFHNCSHEGDAGCAVVAAVEAGQLDERRYLSFMKLNAEQAHNARSLAERRERERRIGRMYKSVLSEKEIHRRRS